MGTSPDMLHSFFFFFFKKVGGFFPECTIFGAKTLHDTVIRISTHKMGAHMQKKTPATQVTDENPLHKNGNPSRLFALQLELFSFHVQYPCHHSSLMDHVSFQLSTTKRWIPVFKPKLK